MLRVALQDCNREICKAEFEGGLREMGLQVRSSCCKRCEL